MANLWKETCKLQNSWLICRKKQVSYSIAICPLRNVFSVSYVTSAFWHIATHYYTLLHTATHCNTLQHTATHCTTLQVTATHCNSLQLTAARRNTLCRQRINLCKWCKTRRVRQFLLQCMLYVAVRVAVWLQQHQWRFPRKMCSVLQCVLQCVL